MPRTWVVAATCLPLVVRRCPLCPSGRYRATGKFRVNAHHKLLDVWLLVRCTGCSDTVKLSVRERVNVRSLPSGLLDRLHGNDPALIAELLLDPLVLHRNRIALDFGEHWRLQCDLPVPPEDEEAVDVEVRFAAPVPVRPVRLIAEGFGLSRGEVERLLSAGRIVSAGRLTGRVSSGFSFTLKR